MKRDLPYLIFSLLILVLVAYKASVMCMTHDESTSFYYFKEVSIWSYLFDKNNWPNANNHWLNTIFFQATSKIFGPHELSIRLPNVIAFIIYSGYYILMTREIKQWYIRMAAFLFIILNPFVTDFFSTARGYGMSMAAMAASLYYSGRFLRNKESKHMVFALISLLLGVLSLFSTIIFLPALAASFGLFFFLLERDWLTWANVRKPLWIGLTGISIIALLTVIPIIALSKNEEFKWGAPDLIEGLKSLAFHSAYGQKYIPNELFTTGFFTALVGYAFYRLLEYLKQKNAVDWRSYFYLHGIVLAIILLIMVVTRHLWNSYYPVDRKAILFIPFVGFIIFSALDLHPGKLKKVMGITFSILLLWHFVRCYESRSVREWWYDASTKEFELVIEGDAKGSKKTLATHWMFYPTLQHYLIDHNADNIALQPYNKNIDTSAVFDYYVIFESDLPVLEKNYQVFYNNGTGRLILKKK